MNSKVKTIHKKLLVKCIDKPGWTVFLFSLFCSIFIPLVIFLIPTSPPLVQINARSETLRFKVTRPEIAVIPIVSGQLIEPIFECEVFEDLVGLIELANNALVRYRVSADKISIEIDSKISAGNFVRKTKQKCVLPPRITFTMPFPSPNSIANTPLPIAGPAEIGTVKQRSRIPSNKNTSKIFGIMYEGELRIFGRTWGNRLYPAQSNPIKLPAGGRLSSLSQPLSSTKEVNLSPWYGLATPSKNGFEISATVEAHSLFLTRPGSSFDAETFTVSHFARLINDPIFAIPTLAFLIFSTALQAFASWIVIWRKVT